MLWYHWYSACSRLVECAYMASPRASQVIMPSHYCPSHTWFELSSCLVGPSCRSTKLVQAVDLPTCRASSSCRVAGSLDWVPQFGRVPLVGLGRPQVDMGLDPHFPMMLSSLSYNAFPTFPWHILYFPMIFTGISPFRTYKYHACTPWKGLSLSLPLISFIKLAYSLIPSVSDPL